MDSKNLRLFIKPFCGWCHEAMQWLDDRGVDYELIDVIRDREAFREMQRISGQTLTPTLEMDGEVLADFGVDELEEWWQKKVESAS